MKMRLNAWLHIVARHKMEALQKDLKVAERQLGENATAENLDRLKMAKKALEDASGNEANLDGFWTGLRTEQECFR